MLVVKNCISRNSKTYRMNKNILTNILWSNWTVVGFSVKFFNFGFRSKISSGNHLSPIFGNELYTKPASKPATNAPKKNEINQYDKEIFDSYDVLISQSPEMAVKYTSPLLEWLKILNFVMDLFITGQFKAGERWSNAPRNREAYKIKARDRWAANRYCDTLGTSFGPSKRSSNPDLTMYQPISPCQMTQLFCEFYTQ